MATAKSKKSKVVDRTKFKLPRHLSYRREHRVVLLIGLMVVVLGVVLTAHWPALSARAFSFDDDLYLTDNPLVQNPSWSAAGCFLTEILEPSTVGGYYQPLAMISLMLDHAIGGRIQNLRPFHRTSLVLHACNTALVIVLLYMLFGHVWVAACVGLLFGVHPMTVEPIPWVGERKTLLAAFFALWCLIFYVRYTRTNSRMFYAGCFLMCLLALMSKPTSTPLPVLLLLLDYWPLGRLRWRAVLEKVPLLVLAGVSGIVTIISQGRTASIEMPGQQSPLNILFILCHNIVLYLYKIVWPANLSWHYAFPKPLSLSHPMVLVGVIGTCVLIVLLLISLRWTKSLIVGWLFFFVAILPTMGVIGFTIVIASDKFAYLPSVGLMLPLAWFLAKRWDAMAASPKGRARPYGIVAVVVALAAMEAVTTHRYQRYWRDTETLYKRTASLVPDAAAVQNGLGLALVEKGKIDEAIVCFEKAIVADPTLSHPYYNLAKELRLRGQIDQAIGYLNQALQLDSTHYPAHNELGIALMDAGRVEEAIFYLRRAVQIKDRYPHAHSNLGSALAAAGRIDEAFVEFHRALEMDPGFHDARINLASTLQRVGRADEAFVQYRMVAEREPFYPRIYNRLGHVRLSQGRVDEALKYYAETIRLHGGDYEAYVNTGVILGDKGEFAKACDYFAKGLKLQPDSLPARQNLAGALIQLGRLDEAIAHYEIVLQLKPDWALARANLASALVKAGRFDEAIEAYKLALGAGSVNADWLAALGDLLVRQNRRAEAVQAFQKALQIKPDHPAARDGLRTISRSSSG